MVDMPSGANDVHAQLSAVSLGLMVSYAIVVCAYAWLCEEKHCHETTARGHHGHGGS